MTQSIHDAVSRLKVAPAMAHDNLTMFPLLGPDGVVPDYATLDEAIRGGWLEVTEVSTGGSVPELKLANRGDRAVLMMDGEELLGAKQNRVLNLTILAPAGQTLIIPVSCVEQGRWAQRSTRFVSSDQALYAKARVSKVAAVSASMSLTGAPHSDQGELWNLISDKMDRLNSNSETGAMHDIYRQNERRVEDYVGAFRSVAGQSGALFAIGDRLVGFDLFEHPDLLRSFLPKIVRSYALDAIEAGSADSAPDVGVAERFLGEVAGARVESFPAVGLGQDLRLHGKGLTGGALAVGERIVHMSAFRTDDGEPDRSSIGRILRSSQRRRR